MHTHIHTTYGGSISLVWLDDDVFKKPFSPSCRGEPCNPGFYQQPGRPMGTDPGPISFLQDLLRFPIIGCLWDLVMEGYMDP